VVAEFADHLATAHNLPEIPDEILAMISKAIHEEVSGAGACRQPRVNSGFANQPIRIDEK